MDCSDVNVLVVKLYFSFVRCYCWEKLNKGYIGSRFLIIACESTIIPISISIKKEERKEEGFGPRESRNIALSLDLRRPKGTLSQVNVPFIGIQKQEW